MARKSCPSRPREVPLQIREGSSNPPPAKKPKVAEVKGKGKAKKVIESESELDSFNDEETMIPLPEGEGEPSSPVAKAVLEKKFVSENV